MAELDFRVLGVGSAGVKIVANMAGKFKHNSAVSADFMACDSDIEKLKPFVDKGAALMRLRSNDKLTYSEADVVRNYFSDADIAFICAGMGGITGSNIAPIAAKIAKESGALTICITTVPFSFEHEDKKQNAETGFEKLEENCDTLFTALSFFQDDPHHLSTVNEFFEKVDKKYLDIIQTFADMSDPQGVNIDFSDFRKYLSCAGRASWFYIESSGYDGINDTVNAALKAVPPNAYTLMFYVRMSEDISIDELDKLLEGLSYKAGARAYVKLFSADYLETNDNKTIKLSAIAIL